MALDISLLGQLSPIFIFILVFVFLYAALLKSKLFSDKAGLNGLIAFSMAFLFIIFPFLKDILYEAFPWVIIMFFCIATILTIQIFMGYKPESIVKWMSDNSFGLVISLVVVFIFIVSLAKVFSDPAAQEAFGGIVRIRDTLLNAKMLGAVLILLIAAKIMHTVGITLPKKK